MLPKMGKVFWLTPAGNRPTAEKYAKERWWALRSATWSIPSPLFSPVKYQCREKKNWRRFRLTLGLIFDTSGWQASQIERARTTYPDSEWHRGEIERQGMYRFQNFFDMGISIFVAIFVHIGYVYICEQILFRLSERLREGG